MRFKLLSHNLYRKHVKDYGDEKMLNTKEKALLSGFLFAIFLSFTSFSGKCERISEKVLRFHIIANSDTQDDQELKLKVRDKVLSSCKEIFDAANNLDDAKRNAELNLDKIAECAEEEIKNNGYDYKVSAKLIKMHFNTRYYNEVTLPAGNYYAVRLTLGEGKGKNWWCVMFPPMCLPAAQEQSELEDVLNPDELDIVKGKKQYEFKFKIVEIFEGIRDWIRSVLPIF